MTLKGLAVKGFVETISVSQVRGWVHDPKQRGVPLWISVRLFDSEIARSHANLFRDDLLAAGVGDGEHAFVVNFNSALGEADVPFLTVYALLADGGEVRLQELSGEPEPEIATPATPRAVVTPPAFAPDVTQRPVFVLGAARSGTSAVAQALLRSTAYDGYEEGHVFVLLAQLLNTVVAYYRDNGEETLAARDTMLARIPMAYFYDTIRETFRTIAPALFSKARWLDKTPSAAMVEASPVFREIWPNAKVIFMKRRALENISSRQRKFPQLAFEDHCADWVRVMTKWAAVKDRLGQSAIEIDQHDMATRPDAVADVLAAFLMLPPGPARRVRDSLRLDRPERTSRDFGVSLALETIDWAPAQKSAFQTICGATMAQFGYSDGPDYFRPRA